MKIRILGCVLLAAIAVDTMAQGGTKSPYSQFGLGQLADQSQGANRGMNGVGLALRDGSQVNTLNPASYSSVDSLTMLLDASVTGQVTNFKEGNVRQNASMGNVEYVAGSFRAWRNVGVSFGLLPYSSVGYSYSTSSYLDQSSGSIVESYSGTGGLHQAFVGVGWRVLKPLSVGVNVAYLWGDIDRSVTGTGSSNVNTLLKTYSASVSSYNVNFGVQWEQPVGKTDRLTVGATVGLGHKLGADPEMMIVSSKPSGTTDTTSFKINNGLQLPMIYGVGVAYRHRQRLTAAADFTLQKWGGLDFPDFNTKTNQYELMSGLLKDRVSLNAGLDWIPNPMSRNNFFSLVHYRLGAGLATPYYNIGGQNGPRQTSLSAGFGIPLRNSRSVINLSGQWLHSSASGLITENTFLINIGLTFNERWFAKWKVE